MTRRLNQLVLTAALAAFALKPASAQEPEIYIGPAPLAPPGSPEPVNYLAKCLADPTDGLSCTIAETARREGGLESAVKGQMTAATYVTCNKPAGICLELATLTIPDDDLPKPADQLPSVDVTILFDFDSSAIRAGEEAKLAQLATAMNDPLNAAASFAVIGHTDSKGTDGYNCELSAARARAVAQRFAALGVAPDRLLTIGAGERILRNEADGEAAENRRVGLARIKTKDSLVMERLRKLCDNSG